MGLIAALRGLTRPRRSEPNRELALIANKNQCLQPEFGAVPNGALAADDPGDIFGGLSRAPAGVRGRDEREDLQACWATK